MNLWQLALTFFLIANPIGNVPVMIALVKDFSFHDQRRILFREAIFSFLIAVVFLFIGTPFLEALHIENYSLRICGGTILFLISLTMIFPPTESSTGSQMTKEPFIVPIATPIITGGGLLSTIMVYAKQEQNNLKLLAACTLAWIAVTIVMVSSAYLQKILGKRGLIAMEQLMGMMLALLSMEIFVKGATEFMHVLQNIGAR